MTYDVHVSWTQGRAKLWETPVASTTTFGNLRDHFCAVNQLLAQHCRLYHNDCLVDNEADVQTLGFEKPSRCICAHLPLQLTNMPVIQVASSVPVNNAHKVVHLKASFQFSIALFVWQGLDSTSMANCELSFVTGLPTKWQTDALALVTKIRDTQALGRTASTSPEQEQPTICTRIVSAMPTQQLTKDWCPVLCMTTACQPQQCLRHVLERAARPETSFQQTKPEPSGAITYNALLHTTLLLLKLVSLAGSMSTNTPNTLVAVSALRDSITRLSISIARYSSNSNSSSSNSNSTMKFTMASIQTSTDIKHEAEEEQHISRLLVILVMPMLEQTITDSQPMADTCFRLLLALMTNVQAATHRAVAAQIMKTGKYLCCYGLTRVTCNVPLSDKHA